MLNSIWIYIADSFTGAYSPYRRMTNGKAEEKHMILHLLEGNYAVKHGWLCMIGKVHSNQGL